MSSAAETDALIRLGKGCALFLDQQNTPFAQVPATGICHTIEARSFDLWLRNEYYLAFGRGVAYPSAMKAATSTLEAIAHHEAKRHPLQVRFNDIGGALWVDLGDESGRAVKIEPSGWEVVDLPPPLFRRFQHMKALPVPKKDGDLKKVLEHVNLTTPEDQMLFVTWLAAAVIPGPRPMLTLCGSAGAAKTSAARLVSSILDPTIADGLALPRKEHELAQVLDHHGIAVFDNLGRVTRDTSDALCRGVTGGSISKRRLRTDGDDFVFTYRRPIVVTAINPPVEAPDLVDRMLLIELGRVEGAARRTAAEVSRNLEEALPALVGGLYTVVAEVLRTRAEPGPINLERMADFHRVGSSAAVALGYTAEDFDRAYRGKLEHQGWKAADNDGIATLLMALGPDVGGRFEGTMSALLELLHARCPSLEQSGLPKAASTLGCRVRDLEPVLQRAGIRLNFDVRHGADGRRVELIWPIAPALSAVA